MTNYLSFFESNIEPHLRQDTNTRIGGVLIALAYPNVILIGPPPLFCDSIVNVEKPGFWVEPDSYPLLSFLKENPEVCEKIITSHEGLASQFKNWRQTAKS